MPLPTTSLTLHCDASDTDKVFKTLDGGGAHSGTPGDGDVVQVWDDEGDGIADVCLKYNGSATAPAFRSSSPLMLDSCLDFDGSDDVLVATTQNGGAAKALSQFISSSAFTAIVAFYAESITNTDGSAPYNNHAVIADNGGFWGIHLRDASGQKKVQCYNWDGNADFVELNINTGESVVIMFRHEGGNLFASVNGGSESSAASGNTSTLTGQLKVGDVLSKFNGRIGEFAIWNAALTGTDLADAISYFTSKWLASSGLGKFFYHMQQQGMACRLMPGRPGIRPLLTMSW